ncbi:unnamed protein product [Calicophoron daubneyi]|uniref:Receptor-type tyrosine-protein phosphatase N2 n=1 Tax=Calicophoron daubneyi TaxID=300641 RepID=A0AAV2T927_CALDB
MRIKRLWFILLLITFGLLRNSPPVSASTLETYDENVVLGGFVGCLFDEVCTELEFCFNDGLFGRCTDFDLEGLVENRLGPTHLSVLKGIFSRLSDSGLNWRNLYVQCLIRTTLYSSEEKLLLHDPETTCGLGPSEQTTNPSSLNDHSNINEQYFIENRPRENKHHSLTKKSNEGTRSVRAITRRLKRLRYRDTNQFVTSSVGSLFYPTGGYKEKEIENNGEAAVFESDPDYRDPVNEFDQELRRYIIQLRKLGYSRQKPSKGELLNEENTADTTDGPRQPPVRAGEEVSEVQQHETEEEPLKRRFRFRLPYNIETPKQPVRSWIWTRFLRRSLDVYEAEQFLRELSNRLHLASPITDYFLDRSGNVLYFQVPKITGSSAESVVEALKQGRGNFDGYQIEDVGFGRGAPVYTSTVPPPSQISSKNYTITMVVCLSILAFVMILFIVYTVHICRRRFRSAGDEKENQKAKLLSQAETSYSPRRSEKDYTPISDEESGVLKKIKNVFSRSSSLKKTESTETTSHIITESVKPYTETSMAQPTPHASVSSSNKDTASSDVTSSTEHKPVRHESHRDSAPSQRSSTSSWSSEPIACGVDITTGHLILSYMEDFLRDPQRLSADWEAANAYEAEEATPCVDAERPENLMKNRLGAPLPYEQTRVKLRNDENDYINASLIYDHSPRNPIYIATPSPMAETLADFWEMVWEQSSVVLVCLQQSSELHRLNDPNAEKLHSDACIQYWPTEGTEIFGKFEVHLVSEHSSCENYVVRSFYLKNLKTEETRTVTQFHYLTWSDENLKAKGKAILEFRRKVNRSFRGILSPIVVHCADGSGRTGTYILLDLVLSRIAKGVKEINIAASLEHLRDQRQSMVETKEQYEFVFTAVAQEVDAMLKTCNQNS